MSKFNSIKVNKTVNLAGGQAYKESDKMKIISILLTSFMQDQYYRNEKQGLNELRNLIDCFDDKKFIAKASLYSRLQMGMRSVNHVIAGELANKVKNETWTKKYFENVVYRVDDITEILSYYLSVYKKPIPNSLKKGLAKAFNKFNEYQLAKYRSENKDLKLIDVVNLIHPKPNAKNKDALLKLVKDQLKSIDTWEVMLTQAGQNSKNDEEKKQAKKEVWKKLLFENQIGYFALLRNLRNISEQAPEYIDNAIELLLNKDAIKKSMVLPFRFLTAYDEISDTKILKALNKAVEISLNNVPKYNGKTLVVLDVSGSMSGQPAKIGSLFAGALTKTNDCDLLLFSDNAEYAKVNTDDTLMTIANSIRFASGGTNFHSIFQVSNKAYDRIFILSDMQGWIGGQTPVQTFNQYKLKYNCNPFIYSFDLQGYGSLQFPENKVFCVAGFSEKIFEIIPYFEKNKNALIDEIGKIEL